MSEKIAYFDCSYGAAGDMLLGALLSAGLPQDKWLSEVGKIALPANSFRVEISDVIRCSIRAKKVDVYIRENVQAGGAAGKERVEKLGDAHSHIAQNRQPATSLPIKHDHAREQQEHGHKSASHSHSHEHQHGHTHEHGHGNEHVHEHEHVHDHDHENGHDHEHHEHVHEHDRGLAEILNIIESSQISDRAKALAGRIFRALAEAESQVHGVPVDEIHFHEVGAVDAIVDIVGFAIAYEMMQITRSSCSALAVGAGHVKTQHGLFPIPAPAVVNLLAKCSLPIAETQFKHECLTPTGAAILSVICDRGGPMPSMLIEKSGYGAGTFNPPNFPNTCRVILGTPAVAGAAAEQAASNSDKFDSDTIVVLETNLDDFSPQMIAFVSQQLFDRGALDVSVTPIVMKKGRSGHLLTVLSAPETAVDLQELILTQTSSIGVRTHSCRRLIAAREWQTVTMPNGQSIRVKVARDKQGKLINVQPEYEDCAEYATRTGEPLKSVMTTVMSIINQGD